MKIKLKENRKNIITDTTTPVSMYLKIRDKYINSILLESSDYSSKDNNYAYICFNPIAEFKIKNFDLKISLPNKKTISKKLSKSDNVMDELKDFIETFEFESSFKNDKFQKDGVFGYMSYDSVKYFETLNLTNISHGDDIPEMIYCVYEHIIVVNVFNNITTIISYSENKNSIIEIEKLLSNQRINKSYFEKIGDIESNMNDEEFINLVNKGIYHCNRGDVFQIVLSRKFFQKFKGDEFAAYRKLRSVNPSPYLFYFDFGDFKIFGSSPEAQLIVNNNKAEIHPIAGTFKRTGNDDYDRDKALELSKDDKENSEHMMLVDLARNDLSISCNEVSVEKDREIQFYSHVIHLVSKVTAIKKNNSSSFQIAADTFPAGTLSGAPKHKAMQLISNYENCNRSFYGGAIGFMDFEDNFNHAIIIRSFLSMNHELVFQAGAGIVSKSNPKSELQEINNKLGALNKALDLAEKI